MKCQKCGNEIRETAKFCDECGTKNTNVRNKQKITNLPFSNKFIQKFLTNKSISIASIVSIALFLILSAIILVPYCTDISSQSSDFNNAESEILQSIDINETYTIEPPTEKLTEKPTEKITEPPTEKPTSITDGKTKLFEDNELAVYYSDVEDYAYSDNKVLVHLLIENKTNQSLKFYADTVVLDGISYNQVLCADPIAANSKGIIEINTENCNNTNPRSIGADLHYRNSNEYSNSITLNIVSHDIK